MAVTASKHFYPDFSKFLDMRAQQLVKNIKAEGCVYSAFGGYEEAERKVMGCFPEGYEPLNELFPVCCIKITPSESEGLTHRDYLGSLTGLGLNRDFIGDIVVGESCAYVFCAESVKDFIILNLKKTGGVSAVAEECFSPVLPERSFKRKSVTIASERLDCVLSAVIGTSRGKTEEVIKSGRVTVNYTEALMPALRLKAADVVSVRGFGKFIYLGNGGTTKKGRLKAEIDIYE